MKGPTSGDRGQSEVIAFLLLVALTVAGTTAILVLGFTTLDNAKERVTIEQTENALTRMDAKVSQVAIGDSPAQEVDLSAATADGSTRITTEGWLRIRILNTSTGAVEETVLNRSLGTLVYENGNTTVAYQGGGVWRARDGNSVMVSKPEFHYRGGTLTFRFLNLTGSAGSDRLTIQDAGRSVQKFPNESSNLLNPVKNQKIRVTVHSPYYEGWGSYFEERTDGGVSYDHASNEVTLTLLKRVGSTRITDAMLINGGGGQLQIQSGKNSVVDSYNSSAIPPTLGPSSPPSGTGNADISTTKDIEFSGNAQITGNLSTSGAVSFSGSPGPPFRVGGHLQYGAGTVSDDDCEDYVAEWCAKNSSVDAPEPIDNEIQDTISNINDSNDNAGEPCFSESNGVEFGGSCGSTVELEAGDYYTTSDLQVQSGEKLLLNTTDGEIRIAVDDEMNVQFQSGGNVTVLGNGTARIYGTKQYQIQGGDTFVWNRGWDATQLWLYCSADCQVQIDSSPTFVGVVYAPSDPGASNAQVQIDGGKTEVYGAIVGGGDSQLKSQADIHFDRAIKSTTPLDRRFLPSISYLHVRTHRVNVSSG